MVLRREKSVEPHRAAVRQSLCAPRWLMRLGILAVPLLATAACATRESGRVDTAALTHTTDGFALRITILGSPNDGRIPDAREAIGYWNRELARLDRRLRLALDTIRADSVPDSVLRAASGEAMFGRGPATANLRAALSGIPADIVIALSQTDLISFSVPWSASTHGVIGIRRADIPPLSLPNTVRNVVAHELGHVLGLTHNADSTTLMCGRPATCRPAAFASDTPRFFPLTASDEQWLRERWP
jgi:hypothetical protein